MDAQPFASHPAKRLGVEHLEADAVFTDCKPIGVKRLPAISKDEVGSGGRERSQARQVSEPSSRIVAAMVTNVHDSSTANWVWYSLLIFGLLTFAVGVFFIVDPDETLKVFTVI